jgi:DNA-binding transcriptional ArsR family regulator
MSQPARELPHLHVLDDADNVAALLSPLRRRIIELLAEPDSASGLARRLGLPRQKLNYHLRELEREGLVELMATRRRRGCVERLLRSTARSFVLGSTVLGTLAADPEPLQDRFSSAYLIAVAARLIADVGRLREHASRAGQRLATVAVETEIGFRSPADLKAFSEELAGEIARLAAKYDRGGKRGSRRYRFVMGGHPLVTKSELEPAADGEEHVERQAHSRQEEPE